MYYSGFDLHKDMSYITIFNEEGDIIKQQKLPNEEQTNLNYFFTEGKQHKAVVESTSYHVLKEQQPFRTFKGVAISRLKQAQWPCLSSPFPIWILFWSDADEWEGRRGTEIISGMSSK
jgi:hypothetical protein